MGMGMGTGESGRLTGWVDLLQGGLACEPVKTVTRFPFPHFLLFSSCGPHPSPVAGNDDVYTQRTANGVQQDHIAIATRLMKPSDTHRRPHSRPLRLFAPCLGIRFFFIVS